MVSQLRCIVGSDSRLFLRQRWSGVFGYGRSKILGDSSSRLLMREDIERPRQHTLVNLSSQAQKRVANLLEHDRSPGEALYSRSALATLQATSPKRPFFDRNLAGQRHGRTAGSASAAAVCPESSNSALGARRKLDRSGRCECSDEQSVAPVRWG